MKAKDSARQSARSVQAESTESAVAPSGDPPTAPRARSRVRGRSAPHGGPRTAAPGPEDPGGKNAAPTAVEEARRAWLGAGLDPAVFSRFLRGVRAEGNGAAVKSGAWLNEKKRDGRKLRDRHRRQAELLVKKILGGLPTEGPRGGLAELGGRQVVRLETMVGRMEAGLERSALVNRKGELVSGAVSYRDSLKAILEQGWKFLERLAEVGGSGVGAPTTVEEARLAAAALVKKFPEAFVFTATFADGIALPETNAPADAPLPDAEPGVTILETAVPARRPRPDAPSHPDDLYRGPLTRPVAAPTAKPAAPPTPPPPPSDRLAELRRAWALGDDIDD